MEKVMVGEIELNVIDAYSRAQGVADGILVDVTKLAKEAGFTCSVALTFSVMAMVKDIPESRSWQDETGRLWDVLYMAYIAARRNKDNKIVRYKLSLPHLENRTFNIKDVQTTRKVFIENVELKMVAGPDDDGSLCITIMLPNED